ncbi:hypothetical protein [Nocardioides abyssi]|uniref:Uncharacterized protein n=1 Tax=Nocardioides abyssi TaxID=3058370 RepID=A0ABT8EYS6_9ACTN|nr:hypothetical protein [Nocardioides abyssi]MDN4163342.1 hypothetical protein [Nocardioides abyssi]
MTPERPPVTWPVRVGTPGGPTRWQARTPAWRSSSRGLYVPAEVDGTVPEQRIVEAAAVLPEHGGVTGWGALRWAGAKWFDGRGLDGRLVRPVTLVTSCDDIRPQRGIDVSAERLDPRDLVDLDGVRMTSPARAVCFEMRYMPTLELAVVHLDMAARDDVVSIEEMREYAARHRGWTGIPQCRAAIPFASENSWSSGEVLMRLLWTHRAGLPRPLSNVPVFDLAGRHIGTPDLFDPVVGVVGEYDGALHLAGAKRSRDLDREELFRSHGLEYVVMLGHDGRDPRPFLARLTRAYERAVHRPPAPRSWTLARPSYWPDTSTVAARRALPEELRQRWLRPWAA